MHVPHQVSRRGAKAGLAPGSLVHVGAPRGEATRLQVIDYGPDRYQERTAMPVQECLPLRDTPSVTWINVDGLGDVDVIEKLGVGFGIHPLVLEDLVNEEQRPKLETFEDYLFVVVKMLSHDESTNRIRSEQVSFVLGRGFLLTFQSK